MLAKIMMCVFVGTLLGALAAAAEVMASDTHYPSDFSDGATPFVSVSAAWNSAQVHP